MEKIRNYIHRLFIVIAMILGISSLHGMTGKHYNLKKEWILNGEQRNRTIRWLKDQKRRRLDVLRNEQEDDEIIWNSMKKIIKKQLNNTTSSNNPFSMLNQENFSTDLKQNMIKTIRLVATLVYKKDKGMKDVCETLYTSVFPGNLSESSKDLLFKVIKECFEDLSSYFSSQKSCI